MAIKKALQEVYDFLNNPELSAKKVGSVLAEFNRLCESKVNRTEGSTYLMNSQNEPVAIRCSEFERWYPISDASPHSAIFPPKKGTSTGLNGMCIDGYANWTARNNARLSALKGLTDMVMGWMKEGNDFETIERLKAEYVAEWQATMTAKSQPTDESLGFVELAELLAHLDDLGIAYNTPRS